MSAGLSEVDDGILRLAGSGADAGAMANAIRDLGMDEVPFYQRLNRLLDDPDALAAYPVVVNRLRRLREGSARRRGRH